MNQIIELLHSGERNKEIYKPLLIQLSDELEKFLANKGYDFSLNSTYDLFKETSDVRLHRAKVQLECAKSNLDYLIEPSVKRCYDVLLNFMSEYHIGHISEMYMTKSGMLRIEISCLIFCSSAENRKATEKEKFELQMEKLKEIGLATVKINNIMRIEFSENNLSILYKLITDLGGRGIETQLRNLKNKTEIRLLNFLINPDILLSQTVSKVEQTIIKTDDLTDDDMLYMQDLISECMHAIGTINSIPSILQTCGKLIEGLVYNCCKIIDVKTEMSIRYENSFITEKEKNGKIHHIEEELSLMTKGMKAKDRFNEIINSIEHWSRGNLSFNIEDARIQRYGGIYITFRFLADPCILIDAMERNELRKKFDCFSLNNTEEVYIKASGENRATIEKILMERLPDCEFEKWNDEIRNKDMAIHSFTISVKSIPLGFEPYDEEEEE